MATETTLPPIVQGDDWAYKITISKEGAGVAIAGDTFFFTLKTDKDALDEDAELQSDGVVPVGADADAGIYYLEVPRSLTAGIEAITYNFDIQWLGGTSDKLRTISIGTVEVQRQITIREA
jgi:hypothetical protein